MEDYLYGDREKFSSDVNTLWYTGDMLQYLSDCKMPDEGKLIGTAIEGYMNEMEQADKIITNYFKLFMEDIALMESMVKELVDADNELSNKIG